MDRAPGSLIERTSLLPRIMGGEPAQRLLRVASSDDARRELGRISVADLPGKGFQIKPKHAYLLLVTMGSGDAYSCMSGDTLIATPHGSHVRMDCIMPGATVTLGDGSRGRVVARMDRSVDSWVDLKAECLPYSAKMSLDHPVMVARKEQFVCARDKYIRVFPDQVGKRGICQRRQCVGCTDCAHLLDGVRTEIAAASTVRPGDFLVSPVPTCCLFLGK